MPKSSHNKPWEMKYTIPSWSESTLFLFKVMCSFEKMICMNAYYSRFPFGKCSGAPYHLAYRANYNLHWVCFDSDSFLVSVDNHFWPQCLPMKAISRISSSNQLKNALAFWHRIDNSSLFFPGLWIVLLNPQHQAQQAQDIVPDPMRTYKASGHLSYTLYWNKKVQENGPIWWHHITPSFHAASGCFHYGAYALTYETLEACHIHCEEAIILPDMIWH